MSTIPLSKLNLFTDLKFEKKNIIFLDSPFSFFEFTINYLSLQKFFSFNILIESMNKASYLQIATIDFIFILDLRKMKQLLEKYKKIEWFFYQTDQLFQSNILKISFNLDNSLLVLNAMFPLFFSFPINIIDIKDIYKIRNLDISSAPYYNYFLNFHKKLALINIQSQENFALYPYLILLIYMNITKENSWIKVQNENNRSLNLIKDMNFSGSIALINENNIEYMQILLNNLKSESFFALDSVCCPKDHVMDLLLIGSINSVTIIDIKAIKKKLFVNSRKIKNDSNDSNKSEQAKTIFLNQLNDLLQNEETLKISYDFTNDFKCLKNRFSKDITVLNNLLNLKNFNNNLNFQDFDDIVYSFFKRKLPIEDFENKQNFFHPSALFDLSTKIYCIVNIFTKKYVQTPFISENLNISNPIAINNKKEINAKSFNNIIQEYDVYYPNMSVSNFYGNYYDYSNSMMIPEFMNMQISTEFISLSDLNFDEKRICLIDKLDENFMKSIQKIKESKIIGIDSEWHPKEKVTAILQIATEKDIFIFDIYGFKKQIKGQFAKNLRESQHLKFYEQINQILTSKEILKVSFDFNNDKINLSNLNKIFDNDYCKMLDFVYYRSAILGQNKGGLKDLVLRIFNKSLCKSMVLSNWKERPLCDQQIKYAALDAFVVLQIYLKIKENLYFDV